MSDTPAPYISPAPLHRAPGLLSAPQLDALAHALDEERQGCAAEPASPLGYWPTAVAGLLGHVEVLSAQRRILAMQTAEAAPVLSRERLAERLAVLRISYRNYCTQRDARDIGRRPHSESIGVLLAAYDTQAATLQAAEARAAEAEAQVAMLKVELGEKEVLKLEMVKENLEWRVLVDGLRSDVYRLEKKAGAAPAWEANA